MSSPKVSIIIPFYNSESSLRACLNSVINQSLNDIEAICVDDCSTDGSSDILINIADIDKRVRTIRHSSNKGEGAARNTGIDNAKGEYIFHLDADDTIPLEAMEKLYKEAHENDSDMAKGRYDLVHSDGQIQHQLWSAPEHRIINTNIDKSAFLQQIPTSHCTYLYRRQLLDQHNIRYRTDLVVGLDLIALATALLHASSVTLIPDIVYYYHQSESSATRGKITAKIAKDAIISKKIVVDMLNARGMHDAANVRLQKWKFIIDSFFREMPSSLTLEESKQTFSDFRDLILDNNIVPWMADTPQHYRYTLALIMAGRDEDALSFLRTDEAYEGFSDQDGLQKSLDYVLEQVPEDIGALIESGRLARSEGDFKKALDIFDKILHRNPDNYDAQLQTVGTLIQLGESEKAQDKLDTTLEQLTKDLKFRQQIKRAATLIGFLKQDELNKAHDKITSIRGNLETVRSDLHKTRNDLHKTRNDLKAVSGELHTVYSSASWRITNPLRKIVTYIKRYY